MTHIPPENLIDIHNRMTVKFDSYSFGIFMWEILTEKLPYDNRGCKLSSFVIYLNLRIDDPLNTLAGQHVMAI